MTLGSQTFRPRIALIGNMNNNMTGVSQYLVAYGYQVDLFLFENELNHFSVAADTIGKVSIDTKVLPWGSYKRFLLGGIGDLGAVFQGYDLLIGSRLAPAYLEKYSDINLDIMIPAGGELFRLPNAKFDSVKGILQKLFVSRYQTRGLHKCKSIVFEQTNDVVEVEIDRLKLTNRNTITPPMINHKNYSADHIRDHIETDPSLKAQIQSLDTDTSHYFMHHCRHHWSRKGNEKVIQALQILKDERPDLSVKVFMNKYGEDWERTFELSQDLVEEGRVIWLSLMPRNSIMALMQACRGVIGEVKLGFLTYGTALEALIAQKPLLHYRKDADYPQEKLYPMLNCFTAADIASQMAAVIDDPDLAKTVGLGGYDWYCDYVVQTFMDEIDRVIAQKAAVAPQGA